MKGAGIALMVVGSVAALTPSAGAQTVGFTGTVYGARGTYPTERVNSVYVFTGVDVTGGPVRVTATVPFVRATTTPEASLTSTPVAAVTSAGVGDPLVRVDARLVDDRRRGVQVGLAGAMKLPVVDASTGRGTGEADYGIGGNAVATRRRTSFMADVLHWTYGDPEGVDFSNTWSYSLGVAQAMASGRSSVVASVSGFSSGIDGASPPISLTAGWLTLVQRRHSLAITATVGLTDSASDLSVGASWRVTR